MRLKGSRGSQSPREVTGNNMNLEDFRFRMLFDDILDEREEDVQILLLAGSREDLQVEVLRNQHLRTKFKSIVVWKRWQYFGFSSNVEIGVD